VKKQASANDITTSAKEAAATKRAAQPLAPSTSQNSVVKSTTKARGRKPSQARPKEDQVATKTRKIPAPSTAPRTTAIQQGTRLNIYVFGSGSMGELGLGPQSSQRNVKRPRLNPNLLPDEVGIVDVAAGGMHCAAVDQKGRVWTWGVNDQGVLGRDTTWSPQNEDADMDEDDDDDKLNPKESVPGLVEGFPEGTVISKIACGDSITVALTTEGKVYAWGTFRVVLHS
jgi:regulator of chromosome condensation